MKISTFVLLFLFICGCNKDEAQVSTPPTPFQTGELLDNLKGEWFTSTCVEEANDQSSFEMMTFNFKKPLSWDDSTFEQSSLELTGKLTVEKIYFNNSLCLGVGRIENLLTTKLEKNNLSIIQKSLTRDSFKAFFVQEKQLGSLKTLDSGSGVILEFTRTNKSFVIRPFNSFTYEGKEFKLSSNEQSLDNKFYEYTSAKNPSNSRNVADLPYNGLRQFFGSQANCGQYYISDSANVLIKGKTINRLILIFSPSKDGISLAFDLIGGPGERYSFANKNLDWIYKNGYVFTEHNLVFSLYSLNRLNVTNLEMKDFISTLEEPKNWNYNQLTNFMKTYGSTPDGIFPICN